MRQTNSPYSATRLPVEAVDIKKQWSNLEIAFGAFVSCFIILSTFCAPEGNIREGDYLPIVLVFLLFSTTCILWAYRLFRKRGVDILKESEDDQTHTKRFNIVLLIDWSLGAYLFFVTLAYLRVIFGHTGEPRLSTNAYWTFITPVLFFFLLRFFRRFCTKSLFLGLCALVIACAVAESSYSVYSYAVLNPRLREAYLANPDEMLKNANLSLAPNSRERLLFEKRLLESSEPTGTYGLANTLAGFLAPMFVLGVAGFLLAVSTLKPRHISQRQFRTRALFPIIALFGGLVVVLCVVILTKSRAGFLASAFGLFLLTFYYLAQVVKTGNKRIKRFVAVGPGSLALMVLAIIVAFALGVVDREVFTEAGKSLGYRIDYWRATYQMILDHPYLGVGPGEFQSIYPRYILPTASEFIADPHNFAFEISALFGLPAFVAFIVFVLSVIALPTIAFWKKNYQLNDKNIESDETFAQTTKSLVVGGALGLVLLFFCSFFQDTPVELSFFSWAVVVLCVSIACFYFIGNQLQASTITLSLIASIAIITLLLNICAAGGIGYPVIATSLFLLAGFVVNFNDVQSNASIKTDASRSAKSILCVLLASICILCVFYASAFKPRCNSFLFSILYDPQSNVSKKNSYMDDLKSGAVEKIDASSSSVVSQFYYFSGLEYFKSPTDDNLERWKRLREQIKRVSPNSPTVRENCGDFDFGLFLQRKDQREFLDSALVFYQDAVMFSPTDAGKRVKLFRAYREKGLLNDALEEAKRALEYDELTPHEDRKLQDDERQELKTYIQNSKDLYKNPNRN